MPSDYVAIKAFVKSDRLLVNELYYWNITTQNLTQNFMSCQVPWGKMPKTSIVWAPPSEFVSSNIPSWQTLTAHAQQFRGARDLAFCLKVPLDSPLVWASREGSGETARMRRLAWTFAARIGDKYQIRLTRPIWADMEVWGLITSWQYFQVGSELLKQYHG